MSRSKKYPIFTDNPHPKAKRFANKAVRNWVKTLEQGFKSKHFRKCYNSWNICDWKFMAHTEEDIIISSRK